jgi:hypothetical protein
MVSKKDIEQDEDVIDDPESPNNVSKKEKLK